MLMFIGKAGRYAMVMADAGSVDLNEKGPRRSLRQGH